MDFVQFNAICAFSFGLFASLISTYEINFVTYHNIDYIIMGIMPLYFIYTFLLKIMILIKLITLGCSPSIK